MITWLYEYLCIVKMVHRESKQHSNKAVII